MHEKSVVMKQWESTCFLLVL